MEISSDNHAQKDQKDQKNQPERQEGQTASASQEGQKDLQPIAEEASQKSDKSSGIGGTQVNESSDPLEDGQAAKRTKLNPEKEKKCPKFLLSLPFNKSTFNFDTFDPPVQCPSGNTCSLPLDFELGGPFGDFAKNAKTMLVSRSNHEYPQTGQPSSSSLRGHEGH